MSPWARDYLTVRSSYQSVAIETLRKGDMGNVSHLARVALSKACRPGEHGDLMRIHDVMVS